MNMYSSALSILSLFCTAFTPTFFASQHTQALTSSNTSEKYRCARSQELYKHLYELITTMPADLIKIIVDYEDCSLQGTVRNALREHIQTVTCFTTLDGTSKLISGSDDGTMIIWDLSTGTCERKIKAHDGSVKSIVLATKHKVVSAAWDLTMKVWDTRTWYAPLALTKKSSDNSPLCSPAYQTIFYEDREGNVILWDIKTGHRVKIKRATKSQIPIRTLISLPGNKVASAGRDQIQIWDCTTKSCTKTMVQPEHKTVGALVFIQPHYLACGYLEMGASEITIWDIESEKQVQKLQGHTRYVRCLALLTDGRLASGSDDGTVKLWDITNIQHARCTATLTPPQTPPNSQESIPIMLSQPSLAPSPSPTVVIEPLPTLPPITALCTLENDNLAVGDNSGKVTIYS